MRISNSWKGRGAHQRLFPRRQHRATSLAGKGLARSSSRGLGSRRGGGTTARASGVLIDVRHPLSEGATKSSRSHPSCSMVATVGVGRASVSRRSTSPSSGSERAHVLRHVELRPTTARPPRRSPVRGCSRGRISRRGGALPRRTNSGKLAHYAVQDPSFRNWMGLQLAVRRNEISDFPICNKSFDLSYCGNDL